ncbi:neutral/alkaline non-lysosomal ceramidase N-terminal domain-containing protein [Candidatus Laterigemmans baculatus]|uniref:neutral/alkaline non-lysosomal ceramidase N-terminal domain-containing protein n=1 Tax=Candidatus Laterigemmans baculatus TaxID=2770505 RepID=UPI0013DA53DF|nr:neutral/alkaline non-lysosomal ceramidase N-terminal domain-containing protein [Candidatus Laterigemmans baculatus]
MRYSVVCLLLVAALGAPLPGNAAEPALRAGAVAKKINPPLGGEIIGGFLPIPAKEIHDDLHARCLVLDDGDTKVALVVCDLLGINRTVSQEARRQIEEKTGIPASHVMISATHTHSATSALGDRFDYQAPLDEYQRFVADQIAAGVAEAHEQLRPAELAFGTAEAPEHVFNRRWFMRPGTVPTNPFGSNADRVKMNPPAGSANLVEPAGPTDPTISFLAVREPGGEPIGLFAAYSLHYVGGVGSGHVSADYYGMFCDSLTRLMQAEKQEPAFVPMMANGTSGDINNINFREPRPRKEPYEQMRYVADDCAARVHEALQDLEYRRDLTLEAQYREPKLAFRHPDAELRQWAEKLLAEPVEESRRANLPRIYAERTLGMAKYPKTGEVPLQLLRIGDVCIGTMPTEVFCEIGLEFKERSPIKPAFLVSLAHGYLGYLPTPRQHRLGGYETWLGTNRLETTASDKMLDQLVEMAEKVKTGR